MTQRLNEPLRATRLGGDGDTREARAGSPPTAKASEFGLTIPPQGNGLQEILACQRGFEQARLTGEGMYGADARQGKSWTATRRPRGNLDPRRRTSSPPTPPNDI
jgi:hypothetical protein